MVDRQKARPDPVAAARCGILGAFEYAVVGWDAVVMFGGGRCHTICPVLLVMTRGVFRWVSVDEV
jgi:hypothetical protein